MSSSGINTGFAKCIIFFMAVVILLQGCVYLGLSIWGFTLRECSKGTADMSNKPLQFATDLIYFLNENCGNPSIKLPDHSESVTLDVDFSKAEPILNRELIFFITYAVISSLWVVTSLSIITTLCGTITIIVNRLCFWTWFLVILAGSILDAFATGYHIHDIINTTSAMATFKYLSITANEKTIEILSNFDAYFVTPAVIMTCLSSRFILIWLINIFGSSFCLSLSNALSKRNSSQQCSIASTSTNPIGSIQQRRQDITLPQTLQQQQVAERSMPVFPSIQTQAPSSAESQTNIIGTAAYGNAEENLSKLNYPPQRNASHYHQELSSLSPLNNRYSTTNESFRFPMQNQRVSEGLRGQLPWSYTSIVSPVPNKPQVQVYPEIPVPDYSN